MKKKLLLITIVLVILSLGISAQTTFSWRNDQNPTSGQWNVANYWWNGSEPALPGGGEILFLDGSIGLNMTNDLPSTNRFRIIFGVGGSSRTIAGSTENTFYDFGGNPPKIENNSSNVQTINFPISLGYNPMEINPVSGNINVGGSINNNGNYIDVYGNNGKILMLSGVISGTGGLTNKNDNYIILTANNSYSGLTTLSAGTLELQASIASSAVTVQNGATLKINGDDVTVASLTVAEGGNVEIVAGKSLTVTNDLDNSGTFTIKSTSSSTGSLIVNGTVTGDVTVERYIAAASDWINANDGWHLLSSPVASQAISGVWTPDGSSSNDYDFFAWDESQQLYLNQKVGANNINTFDPGVGYFVAYQATATPEFTGAPNTTSQTENLTLSGAPAADNSYGYTLLGNPFQSAIDWSHASWDKTDVGGVAKIWNNGAFIDIDDDPSIIPAMNGFFVSTSTDNNSFTIPAAARVHNSQNWYKSVSNNTIKLIAKDVEGNLQQESRIRFNTEATAGFDQAFDGPFMTGYAPLFYSTDETHLYSTNTLPELHDELEIPFSFVKNAHSSFEIELAQSIEGMIVYLTDFKSGIQHNLTETPTYSFTASEGDNPNRFLLHFGVVGIGEQEQAPTLQVYMVDNRLYVNNSLEQAQLAVYDLQGRLVAEQSLNSGGLQSLSLDLPAGVYIVRLNNASESRAVKINVQ
ncbi:MAG: T9SS type A sorting domain-containing protein [Bacteroidetes bacterium]|jgi:autotransporter-associated beta strand protein|nr:T9SS type A sorting domain-containing protein [Bacteroidota bacterium]